MDYLVNTDGGSRGNPGPAGFGFTISDGDGHLLLERAGFLGRATNNVAEYMAVVVALEEIGAADPSARVTVRADSKLVVEQLSGSWKIKNADLQQLALRARRAHPPAQVRYVWVPRAENAAADALANRAMDEQADYTRGQLTSRAGTGDDVGGEGADGSGRAGVRGDVGGEGADGSGRAEAGGEVGDEAYVTPDPAPETREEAPEGAARRREGEPVVLVFVRHGETEMTGVGAHSGGSEPGPSLSAEGREQAGRAAGLLERLTEVWPDLPAPTRVWTSPMVRTRETAEVIAGRLGLTPDVVEDLREGDFGDWQGLTHREIREGWPGELDRWHYVEGVQPPGGESFAQVAGRVRDVAGRALAEHAGESVVLVCHNIVTKSGIGTLAGMDPQAWYDTRIPPGSISILRLWPESHELVVLGLPGEVGETRATDTLF